MGRGEGHVHERAALGHARLGEPIDGAPHLELDGDARLRGERLGHDPLQLKRPAGRTYWLEVRPPLDARDYLRQYRPQ